MKTKVNLPTLFLIEKLNLLSALLSPALDRSNHARDVVSSMNKNRFFPETEIIIYALDFLLVVFNFSTNKNSFNVKLKSYYSLC